MMVTTLSEVDRSTQEWHCGTCEPSTLVSLERTRWFPRQLVSPDDLTQDQVYVREKLRRHNRLLHGWGIVCGARVRKLEGCRIAVEAGYLLGPYGDEILIPEEVSVDLCREDIDGFAVCEPADYWCADVHAARPERRPLYVAVRYCARPTRPVRTISCGCGCDETDCEHSRVRDGYAIGVLEELPANYREMRPPARDALQCAAGERSCPPCPSDDWVVLADVTLSEGEVAEIDCASHRRYVASFSDFYFTCPPAPLAEPPVIIAHWPPNGANLASPGTSEERRWRQSWQERKRVEISFDQEMDAEQLAEPNDWLRVWRVADLFEAIPAEKVQLTYDPQGTSTLGVMGFTAVYDVGELERVGGPIRYLVQIRSADGTIENTATPPVDLDADFKGTSLSVQTQDAVWDGGFQTPLGRNDWDALVSTGAALPSSGDGSPGGRFALIFDAPRVAEG